MNQYLEKMKRGAYSDKLIDFVFELAKRVRELENDKRIRDRDDRLSELYDHHITVQRRLKDWKSN